MLYENKVTTHVVRLKLFRLRAEGVRRVRLMRFFLTVFSLQANNLSSYSFTSTDSKAKILQKVVF